MISAMCLQIALVQIIMMHKRQLLKRLNSFPYLPNSSRDKATLESNEHTQNMKIAYGHMKH